MKLQLTIEAEMEVADSYLAECAEAWPGTTLNDLVKDKVEDVRWAEPCDPVGIRVTGWTLGLGPRATRALLTGLRHDHQWQPDPSRSWRLAGDVFQYPVVCPPCGLTAWRYNWRGTQVLTGVRRPSRD